MLDPITLVHTAQAVTPHVLDAIHTVQTLIHAHPVAVHRILKGLCYLRDGFGALRTIDWAWKKFGPQTAAPTPTPTALPAPTVRKVTVKKTVTTTITIEEKKAA